MVLKQNNHISLKNLSRIRTTVFLKAVYHAFVNNERNTITCVKFNFDEHFIKYFSSGRKVFYDLRITYDFFFFFMKIHFTI